MKTQFKIVLCMAAALMSGFAAHAAKKPNVVILLADDIGWDDVGFNGNPIVETPHLDAMAEASAQFTSFYVTPGCAPTRAALMTGRYHYKTGVWGVHANRNALNLDEQTLAETLQQAGYRTALFGKWHLGKQLAREPWNRGFDAVEHLNGSDKFNGTLNTPDGYKKLPGDIMSTEYFMDRTLDFIGHSDEKPFFVYLPFHVTHGKWGAYEKDIAKYEAKGMSKRLSVLYSMVDCMDRQVGRLFDTLDERGLREDTIVMFFSDNGPWPLSQDSKLGRLNEEEMAFRRRSNFRGGKGSLEQGGVKSPLLIQWQGHIAAAKIDQPIHVTDVYPTLLDTLGIQDIHTGKPLDGLSFRSLLEGQPYPYADRHIMSYSGTVWWRGKQGNPSYSVLRDPSLLDPESLKTAVYHQQWKLFKTPEGDFLYDLKKDPTETTDLSGQFPEVAARLDQVILKNWQAMKKEAAFKPLRWAIGFPREDKVFITPATPVDSSSDAMITVEKAIGGHWQTGFLSGIRTAGQSARYTLDVLKAGSYRIDFKFNPEFDGSDFDCTVSVGAQSSAISGNTSAVLELEQGVADLLVELNRSLPETTAFEYLDRIIISPAK